MEITRAFENSEGGGVWAVAELGIRKVRSNRNKKLFSRCIKLIISSFGWFI